MKRKKGISFEPVILLVAGVSFATMLMGPHFSQRYESGRMGQLIDGLEKMRVCVEIYKGKNGQMPPTGSFEEFEKAMTGLKQSGEICMEEIPVNPFNGMRTVRFDGQKAGVNDAGWRFNSVTGAVQADDSTMNASL
jgi:hypothetical protein